MDLTTASQLQGDRVLEHRSRRKALAQLIDHREQQQQQEQHQQQLALLVEILGVSNAEVPLALGLGSVEGEEQA
jgi:transcription initiation factor TFIID subunit TAF12